MAVEFVITRLCTAKAQELLRKYLDKRIHFFRDNSLQGGRSWNLLSEDSQQILWLVAFSEATHSTLPVLISLSLFLVAEIDIPGKRIVCVAPDDLVHMAFTLPLNYWSKP